jgi:hypothetical protein
VIVDPDFLDHWRTGMVKDALADELAPLYILRLWAHCQERKSDTFAMPTRGLKAQCKYHGDAEAFEAALIDAGFVERNGDSLHVIGWAEKNASLLAAWSNGKKGGRPQKEPKSNPAETHGKPTGSPAVAQGKPSANQDLTQAKPIREEKKREEENPPTPLGGDDVDDVGSEGGLSEPKAWGKAPTPKPDPAPRGPKGKGKVTAFVPDPYGFGKFWSIWPANERKQDRAKCAELWKAKGLDDLMIEIIADVELKLQTKKWADGYIEAPLVYLRNRRWEDGVVPQSTTDALGKAWDDNRSSIEAKGIEVGIGQWDEHDLSIDRESFQAYTERVRAAMKRQGSA